MVRTVSRLIARAVAGWLLASATLWVQFRFGLAASFIGEPIPAFPGLRLTETALGIHMLLSAFWFLPLGLALHAVQGFWRPATAALLCPVLWVISADNAAFEFQIAFGTTWAMFEPFCELVFTPALTLPCVILGTLGFAALHASPRLGGFPPPASTP